MATREQNLKKMHLLLKQCFDLAKASGINFIGVVDGDAKSTLHRYMMKYVPGFDKQVVNQLFKQNPGLAAQIRREVLEMEGAPPKVELITPERPPIIVPGLQVVN